MVDIVPHVYFVHVSRISDRQNKSKKNLVSDLAHGCGDPTTLDGTEPQPKIANTALRTGHK